MKTLEQLLSELFARKPSLAPLLKGIFERPEWGKKLYSMDLIRKFEEVKERHDERLLHYLCVISFADGVDNRFTDILCRFLKDDWHRCHEDIVSLLEDIKDPQSVDCLYQRALEIPDYDDGRALAIKCIWALGAINTGEAKKRLVLLTRSGDKITREHASEQLHYLDQPGQPAPR